MLKLRRAIVLDADHSRIASATVDGHAARMAPSGRGRGRLGPGARADDWAPRLEQDLLVELGDRGGQGRRGRSPIDGAEVQGAVRAAIADVALVGRAEVGDEVIVNVQALDLGLGSGGFDIVHVNLTRGLAGGGAAGANVMKLNYTSL